MLNLRAIRNRFNNLYNVIFMWVWASFNFSKMKDDAKMNFLFFEFLRGRVLFLWNSSLTIYL